ncbi:major capsid protein [Oceanobacillus sp. Castelsardo]|uniref:major capsid protein n=1 Tax=Oceanobacillus sp. Castelsardo TaxID=1851204 RepID=UPI000839A51C|nr:major capsid protein [Oceanobacillus sp. Castelsardo]
MPLRLPEFQQPQLTGYVQNVPQAREYLLRQFLPTENVFDINFAYNVINGKYASAASITGWNASAPLRDTKEIEKAFGQVAKVQHGFRLDETQLIQYNRPRTPDEANAVVEQIYQSTDELSQGVDDIEEYMRAQAVYTGKLKYDDDENDIHINIDFDIPSENKVSATTPWSEAGSTPLSDLQAGVEQFKKQNQRRKPVVMHITSATEANLLQNEQIRTQVYGKDSGQRLLTKADIQNVFSALGLPPYQINDDVIVIDDKEVQLLEDNKAVLIGSDLGKTMLGPTVENNYTPGKFAVPTVKTNPPEESVVVGEAVFPALKRPQSIVIMSV